MSLRVCDTYKFLWSGYPRKNPPGPELIETELILLKREKLESENPVWSYLEPIAPFRSLKVPLNQRSRPNF